MNLGLGLGLSSSRRGAAAALAVTFGALTASGAGGVAVTGTSISSGDASGHWQIVSGRICPSATGATADLNLGPYNLGFNDGTTKQVTIEPDTFSARTAAEFEAAAEAAQRGQTVKLRPGSYGDVTVNPTGARTGTGYVTITSYSPIEDPASFERILHVATGGGADFYHYTGLTFAVAAASTNLEMFGDNGTATNDVKVSLCTFGVTGQTRALAQDCPDAIRFTGTGSRRIAEDNIITGCLNGIVLTGADSECRRNIVSQHVADCYKIIPPAANFAFECNVGHSRYVGYDTFTIVSITKGATTLVEVSEDVSGLTIGDDGLLPAVQNWTYTPCGYNISAINAGTKVLTLDWDTSAQPAPGASLGTIQVLGTHSDFLQFQFSAGTASADMANMQVRNNRCWRGTRSDLWTNEQMFFSNGNVNSFDGLTMEGNMALAGSSHGMTISVGKNCVIKNNVVLHDLTGVVASAAITINGSETGNVILNNIANAYSVPASAFSDNNTTVAANLSAYQAIFPDYASDGANDAAFLIDLAISPASAEYGYAYRRGAAGTGYIDFADADNNSIPVAAAPGQPSGAAWSVIDAQSGGALTLTFISYPAHNNSAPVRWEYQVDGGSWTDSGTGALTTAAITGLVNSQQYSVAVRLVNGAGNGTAAAAKTATPTLSTPANSYRSTYADTANKASGTSYTFNNCDIGSAHANRVVVVGAMSTQNLDAPVVNGVTATAVGSIGNGKQLWRASVASGTSVTITLANNSGSSSTSCTISIWAIYPASATPVDSGTASASGTTTADILNLEIVTGGYAVYFGGSGNTDYTVSWNGADTPVEDYDALTEALGVVAGHIVCTESNATRDLSLTAGASSLKYLLAASWGAQ